jgi:polyisoprenoid-binding protein YceI
MRKWTSLLAAIVLVLGAPSAPTAKGTTARATDALVRYRLDATQSRFVARALRGGLLWFLGHNHLIAARDFTGVAAITPGALTPASLEMSVRSASLAETSSDFTDAEKKIIDGELRTIVLLPDRFPEITFRSTGVTAKQSAPGRYHAEVAGDLTLLGVTRRVVIPADVTIEGGDLRARGEFSLERSDFNVKATSAKGGTIRVRDKLKFTFDLVAHRA